MFSHSVHNIGTLSPETSSGNLRPAAQELSAARGVTLFLPGLSARRTIRAGLVPCRFLCPTTERVHRIVEAVKEVPRGGRGVDAIQALRRPSPIASAPLMRPKRPPRCSTGPKAHRVRRRAIVEPSPRCAGRLTCRERQTCHPSGRNRSRWDPGELFAIWGWRSAGGLPSGIPTSSGWPTAPSATSATAKPTNWGLPTGRAGTAARAGHRKARATRRSRCSKSSPRAA